MTRKTAIALALLLAAIIAGAAFSALRQEPEASIDASVTDPMNATYLFDGEPVRLDGGTAQTPEMTTTVFEASAHGDLDGDGTADTAVVLIRDGGGSGTHFYVSALLSGTGGPSDTVLIGDRIAPQSTLIQDGAIVFNYADRAPGEPFTVPPSVGKTAWVVYESGELKLRP